MLANEGKTVVCTIHQPRSTVFSMFDDLILLAGGSVIYCGTAKNVTYYFKEIGYECPDSCSVQEYIADLISIDTSDADSLALSKQRIQNLIDHWKQV